MHASTRQVCRENGRWPLSRPTTHPALVPETDTGHHRCPQHGAAQAERVCSLSAMATVVRERFEVAAARGREFFAREPPESSDSPERWQRMRVGGRGAVSGAAAAPTPVAVPEQQRHEETATSWEGAAAHRHAARGEMDASWQEIKVSWYAARHTSPPRSPLLKPKPKLGVGEIKPPAPKSPPKSIDVPPNSPPKLAKAQPRSPLKIPEAQPKSPPKRPPRRARIGWEEQAQIAIAAAQATVDGATDELVAAAVAAARASIQADEVDGAARGDELEHGAEREAPSSQAPYAASSQAQAATPVAGDDERPPVVQKSAMALRPRGYLMPRSVEKGPTRSRSEPVGVRYRDRAVPGPAALDLNAAASPHVAPFVEATDVGTYPVTGSCRPRGGEPRRSRSPPLPIMLLRAEERRRAAAANAVAGSDSVGVFEPMFEPTKQPINVTRRMEQVQSTFSTGPSRALAAVPVD